MATISLPKNTSETIKDRPIVAAMLNQDIENSTPSPTEASIACRRNHVLRFPDALNQSSTRSLKAIICRLLVIVSEEKMYTENSANKTRLSSISKMLAEAGGAIIAGSNHVIACMTHICLAIINGNRANQSSQTCAGVTIVRSSSHRSSSIDPVKK